MVYKKYIKRKGKTFGPYYYESYREDGKVKTRFVSGPKKWDINNWMNKKNIILFIIFIVLICVNVYLYDIFNGSLWDFIVNKIYN
jgi:hypothetical protein